MSYVPDALLVTVSLQIGTERRSPRLTLRATPASSLPAIRGGAGSSVKAAGRRHIAHAAQLRWE